MGCPFLANPNLPSGSAQATSAGSTGWNAPVSDRNAYSGGANSGPSTEVSGAGLNPAATVGVRLDGTDYNTATWNLSATTGPTAGAGIKNPVLTGMATKSELTNGLVISLVSPENEHGAYIGPLDTLDSATVTYGETGVLVNVSTWDMAGPNDYVPFEISALEIGRSVEPGITGPSLNGVQADPATQAAMVEYSLGGILSPDTQVNLPTYTPPVPVVVSDNPTGAIQLTLNGVFQVTGSTSDSYQVKLYDTNSDLLWEDTVPTAGYAGAWNGLAWSYSLTADLGHNSSGQIVGPLGSPIASPANIWEDLLPSPLNSTSVEVQ